MFVPRSAAAVSVGVWPQHPEADPGCDGRAAASPGHPEQSGKADIFFFSLRNRVLKHLTALPHTVPFSGHRADDKSADAQF